MKKVIGTLLLALAWAGPVLAGAGVANARADAPRRSVALTCPTGTTCGSYTVPGLGARKQQVLSAGASVLDLAVALEESKDMLTSNYPFVRNPYGDNPFRIKPDEYNPFGDNKTGDSANFGIFKQNWGMLRLACSQFKGQTAAKYNNGAVVNNNLNQDVSCMNQDQSQYGATAWFAGQRAGATGLKNPNTADINSYKTAVYWIRDQLNSNAQNLKNDSRFWVYVPSLARVASSIVGDTAQNGTTIVKAVPAGAMTVHREGYASGPVRITFSDGAQMNGVATLYTNGDNMYRVTSH